MEIQQKFEILNHAFSLQDQVLLGIYYHRGHYQAFTMRQGVEQIQGNVN